MLTCRELIDFILDYLEGELPQAQRAELERHLAVCPECVDYLESYRTTIVLARDVARREDEQAADAPEALIAAILAARSHSGI